MKHGLHLLKVLNSPMFKKLYYELKHQASHHRTSFYIKTTLKIYILLTLKNLMQISDIKGKNYFKSTC